MALRNWWTFRITILALVMLSMGWLSVGTGNVFASPDENANAFFAQTFSETGSLIAFEPLNDIAQGIIHPRSTVAPGTVILPTSFLGFPLVTGVVRFAFGTIGMLAFTPIVAISAVLSLWWLVRRLTSDELLADLSALFMLTHPAFLYYSTRVMMPNVAFVSLLVIGVSLFVRSCEKRSTWLGIVAGVIAGIGLSMRLVEAPILMIVALIVLVAYRKSVPMKPLVSVTIGVVAVLIGYLAVNAHVYGSITATGYTLRDVRVVSDSASTIATTSPISSIVHLLLPFGFHPRAMLVNAFRYGWLLYPIPSSLAVFGAWFAWKSKEHQNAWRTFVTCLGVASIWMIVVYGSWSIADNPDPKAITIGNSHVRYWLPLFVASSVLASLAVVRSVRWMVARMKRRHHNISFQFRSIVHVIALVVVMTMLSAQTVFAGPDGLLAARAASMISGEKRAAVIVNTEESAVVIVDRADKYLFPYRRVIVPLRSDSTYAAMPTLAPIVPLYYFGITFPEIDLDYLNNVKLSAMNLSITPIVTIHDETLYRIQIVEKNTQTLTLGIGHPREGGNLELFGMDPRLRGDD